VCWNMLKKRPTSSVFHVVNYSCNLINYFVWFMLCSIVMNALDSKGNYSATSNNMKLAPPSPLLAVPNVTAHPSTVSVPMTVLLYDGLYSAVLML